MQYSADQLVRPAKREKNGIRPYLFVNPLQGKHIPVHAERAVNMCGALAAKISAAYPDETLYVIGFAETATAIAASVCSFLKVDCRYQTTTREVNGQETLLFSESHSHASDQFLRTDGIEEALEKSDRILFIDDEVTTGNTICNLIDCLRKRYGFSHLKYGIASILNSMTDDRMAELEKMGIDCVCLCRIPYEYGKDRIIDVPFEPCLHLTAQGTGRKEEPEVQYINPVNPRSDTLFSEYRNAVNAFADSVLNMLRIGRKPSRELLVLGTEEFMFPTFVLGQRIRKEGLAEEVFVHATTRSPITAWKGEGYPLTIRYQLRSPYDPGRKTFIYNLRKYDRVIILTDAPNQTTGFADLYEALEMAGNTGNIMLAGWRYA